MMSVRSWGWRSSITKLMHPEIASASPGPSTVRPGIERSSFSASVRNFFSSQ
jgi:hypothetical protein